MSGWNPIATAPEATPVLLFFPEGERGLPCETGGQKWGGEWWGPGVPNGGLPLDETMGGYGDGPTHWRWRDAPPK